MLSEVALQTPLKGTVACSSPRAHTIDCDPLRGHTSRGRRRGFVGKVTDEDLELVMGRAACFGDTPLTGPPALFEPTVDQVDCMPLDMLQIVDSCQ